MGSFSLLLLFSEEVFKLLRYLINNRAVDLIDLEHNTLNVVSYLGKGVEVVEAVPTAAAPARLRLVGGGQIEVVADPLVTRLELDVGQVEGAQNDGGGVVVDQIALLATLWKPRKTNMQYPIRYFNVYYHRRVTKQTNQLKLCCQISLVGQMAFAGDWGSVIVKC